MGLSLEYGIEVLWESQTISSFRININGQKINTYEGGTRDLNNSMLSQAECKFSSLSFYNHYNLMMNRRVAYNKYSLKYIPLIFLFLPRQFYTPSRAFHLLFFFFHFFFLFFLLFFFFFFFSFFLNEVVMRIEYLQFQQSMK